MLRRNIISNIMHIDPVFLVSPVIPPFQPPTSSKIHVPPLLVLILFKVTVFKISKFRTSWASISCTARIWLLTRPPVLGSEVQYLCVTVASDIYSLLPPSSPATALFTSQLALHTADKIIFRKRKSIWSCHCAFKPLLTSFCLQNKFQSPRYAAQALDNQPSLPCSQRFFTRTQDTHAAEMQKLQTFQSVTELILMLGHILSQPTDTKK